MTGCDHLPGGDGRCRRCGQHVTTIDSRHVHIQLSIDEYRTAQSATVSLRQAAERASARGERRFADELHHVADQLEAILIRWRQAAIEQTDHPSKGTR